MFIRISRNILIVVVQIYICSTGEEDDEKIIVAIY